MPRNVMQARASRAPLHKIGWQVVFLVGGVCCVPLTLVYRNQSNLTLSSEQSRHLKEERTPDKTELVLGVQAAKV